MIRTAKSVDFWRDAYRTEKYSYVLDELIFNGIYGIDKIKFNKGIYAICGLNGAGKSTMISFLKDIMGVKLDEFDKKKIASHVVSAKFSKPKKEYQNCDKCRVTDSLGVDSICAYVDYKSAIFNLNFFSTNKNLDELLEQYEDNVLPANEISELSYIIGKEYSSCTIIEVDDEILQSSDCDVVQDDNRASYPFFKVSCLGVEYDSISMGVGEHFLFYIYWLINKIEDEKILIIEEPETFISIKSQINLMNYLAKISSEKGISIVVSTHSPFILENIRQENVCVISRYGSSADITYPLVHEQSLSNLGLTLRKRGIMYFEDEVALLFAKTLLMYSDAYFVMNDYNFEIAGCVAQITTRLKFPISEAFEFQIIGIYDGDSVSKVKKVEREIKCKYLFLPCEVGVESVFKGILRTKSNEFSSSAGLPLGRVISTLAVIDGDESHDWLINFARRLGTSKEDVVRTIFKIWVADEENEKLHKKFIDDILGVCSYNM